MSLIPSPVHHELLFLAFGLYAHLIVWLFASYSYDAKGVMMKTHCEDTATKVLRYARTTFGLCLGIQMAALVGIFMVAGGNMHPILWAVLSCVIGYAFHTWTINTHPYVLAPGVITED